MIQMHHPVGKGVSSGRADEMVLAGSAPSKSASDPIAHIHRGTSFIVLVDGAIVIYLLAVTFVSLGFFTGPTGSLMLALSVFSGLMVYSGYRHRKPWAYWPAVLVLFSASLLFAFLAFINLLEVLLSGYLTSLLFVFLMGWASLGSGRRAVFHWHPAYRAGYLAQDPLASFDLQEGEMLAACPSCLAVLAIRPTLLGRADRCPHCAAALVSEDVINRYGEEEA